MIGTKQEEKVRLYAQKKVLDVLTQARSGFVIQEALTSDEKDRAALEALDELAALVVMNVAHTEANLAKIDAEAARAKASGFSAEDSDIVAGIAALAGLIH